MKQVIIRLYRYRDALYKLKRLGFTKIFSENLSDSVGVTASQVRKDLHSFGTLGKKKGGYQIDALLAVLNEALGKNQVQNVIIVGAGHIGMALSNYKGFQEEGIKICAIFDKDPARIQPEALIPVLPVSQMRALIQEQKIRVAIIAVPDQAAQEVLDVLAEAGIQGVLNFANVRLSVPREDFVLNDVDVALELETVIYSTNASAKEREAAGAAKSKIKRSA